MKRLFSVLLFFPTLAFSADAILSWTNGVGANATWSTVVERKGEACTASTTTPFVEITVVPITVLSYTNTGLTDGQTYCYRLAHRNSAGTGPYSNLAGKAFPQVAPTTAPIQNSIK